METHSQVKKEVPFKSLTRRLYRLGSIALAALAFTAPELAHAGAPTLFLSNWNITADTLSFDINGTFKAGSAPASNKGTLWLAAVGNASWINDDTNPMPTITGTIDGKNANQFTAVFSFRGNGHVTNIGTYLQYGSPMPGMPGGIEFDFTDSANNEVNIHVALASNGKWIPANINPADLQLYWGGDAFTPNPSSAIPMGLQAGPSTPVINSALTATGTYGSGFTTYTITASGSPKSFSATGLPDGLEIDKDTGAITGTPMVSGTFSATIGATNDDGSDSKTLVFDIAKAELTVSGVTVADKTYDGTTGATLDLSGAVLFGAVNNDNLALDGGSATGSFPGSGVGKQSVELSGFAVSGAGFANYTLTQPTVSASITAAPITVTATAGQSKLIGESDPKLTYSLTGGTLFGGDQLTGALSRAAGETAGDYLIDQNTLSAGENYSLTFIPANFHIAALNVAPVFTSGGDVSVAQDAGPQTLAWALGVSPGAQDEAGQTLSFTVQVDNPALFATLPAIAPDGTLTFAPAPQGSGTAKITVTLHDNGGTAGGGVDTSEAITFNISVTTYDEENGTYNGLVQPAPDVDSTNANAGLIRVVVGKKGVFTGSLKLTGQSFALRGQFDKGGVATFGKPGTPEFVLVRKGLPPLALSLQLAVANDADKLTGALTDAGAPFSVVEADRALYTAAKKPKAPFITTPAELPGRYTVALTGGGHVLIRNRPSLPGDGVGILTVASNGTARLTGTLADGTPFTAANAISKLNTWPLYASFQGSKGSISGPLTFRDVADISDVDGSDLYWFKGADTKAKRYPNGWPYGLRPTLIGSKFTQPKTADRHTVMAGLPPAATNGNAEFILTDGNLPQPITHSVNITASNLVTVTDPGVDTLAVHLRFYDLRPISETYKSLAPAWGRVEGSFLAPGSTIRKSFKGVILQKQGIGTGFFLGETECGAISLTPKVP